MIVGLDEIPKLSKASKRLLAELAGNRYFDAIKEFAELDIIIKATEIINNPATPHDIRLEQIGRINGIKELLYNIREIQKESFDDN